MIPARTVSTQDLSSSDHPSGSYPDEGNAFCFQIEDASFWFQYRNRFILEIVERFPPSGPIVDIGGGNGFVSRALEAAGFPTIVVEPGPAGVRNARSRGLQRVIHARLDNAGFNPGSLDAAGLFDVVEHVKDDDAFLKYLRTLMKSGGRLYLTVPAFRALWSSEDDLVGHHHRYTIGVLRRKLKGAGFAVDYATYLFSPLPVPLFLLRTVPSKFGRRQTLDAAQTAAELQPKPGLAVKAITKVLDGELALVKRLYRIPFGTSCLVAATAIGG